MVDGVKRLCMVSSLTNSVAGGRSQHIYRIRGQEGVENVESGHLVARGGCWWGCGHLKRPPKEVTRSGDGPCVPKSLCNEINGMMVSTGSESKLESVSIKAFAFQLDVSANEITTKAWEAFAHIDALINNAIISGSFLCTSICSNFNTPLVFSVPLV
ncbi:hypothetical protein OSB04_012519 [Centaurea solstitialis]|uniref:Uncharacterized protein n=1 Tax=Centaurea solstitialis TaxID=347529 RepID=A0AA38TN88_9ASTR|nr:hypothetical protein OSB04_012519 [Centaurea solstitialis]